jgi:hypothetical protein
MDAEGLYHQLTLKDHCDPVKYTELRTRFENAFKNYDGWTRDSHNKLMWNMTVAIFAERDLPIVKKVLDDMSTLKCKLSVAWNSQTVNGNGTVDARITLFKYNHL